MGSQCEAAKILKTNQSTISRWLRKTQDLFESVGIQPAIDKQYSYEDSQNILKGQRKLHQLIRFETGKGLRIQATCWGRHLLLEPTPEGWITNAADINHFNHCEPLQLLEEHIIDAALVTNPEAPNPSDSRYARYHLSNQPLFILIPQEHTLANEQGLSRTEVAHVTQLGHSGFVSKECRAVMEMLDNQLFGEQDHPYTSSYKEPPRHTRRYGTAMTMLIRPDLTRLGIPINFPAADILVVKQEHAEHPEILKLVFQIKRMLRNLQPTIDGLDIQS